MCYTIRILKNILYISDGKLMDGQVIQLEDGSAAYVQHVPMPKNSECNNTRNILWNDVLLINIDIK